MKCGRMKLVRRDDEIYEGMNLGNLTTTRNLSELGKWQYKPGRRDAWPQCLVVTARSSVLQFKAFEVTSGGYRKFILSSGHHVAFHIQWKAKLRGVEIL